MWSIRAHDLPRRPLALLRTSRFDIGQKKMISGRSPERDLPLGPIDLVVVRVIEEIEGVHPKADQLIVGEDLFPFAAQVFAAHPDAVRPALCREDLVPHDRILDAGGYSLIGPEMRGRYLAGSLESTQGENERGIREKNTVQADVGLNCSPAVCDGPMAAVLHGQYL